MSALNAKSPHQEPEIAAPLRCLVPLLLAGALAVPGSAMAQARSAANEVFDNPFLAIGVNPASGIVTGYLSALYTAPGRTEVCKFVFHGHMTPAGTAKLAIQDAVSDNDNWPPSAGRAFTLLTSAKGKLRIDLPAALAPGECEWIIGMLAGPNVAPVKDAYVVTVDTGPPGDWIAVATIAVKRAFFHDAPDANRVRKAYLVAGDVAYVLEERPGWYRVRYTHAKRESTGWIRRADTFQWRQDLIRSHN